MLLFFFFNDTATTEIYTLSLHDALPICVAGLGEDLHQRLAVELVHGGDHGEPADELRDQPELHQVLGHHLGEDRVERSEEHTSELQSRQYLVCRLLLEKKKNN